MIEICLAQDQAIMTMREDGLANRIGVARVHTPIFHPEIEFVKLQVEGVSQVDGYSDFRRAVPIDRRGCQVETATVGGGRVLPEIGPGRNQVLFRSNLHIMIQWLLDGGIFHKVHHVSRADLMGLERFPGSLNGKVRSLHAADLIALKGSL
jgi:hypothetical protein